jgi:ubiquitin carboxyl-terminal hydrolase 14
MVKVNVKWGKNSYDVELDASDGLETFQASLFSLTNVPAERQKLMLKGKFIKSDADLATLSADSRLMLMGTADTIAPAPTKTVLFEEDLTEKDRVALAPSTVTSAGLVNLGNTCQPHTSTAKSHLLSALTFSRLTIAPRSPSPLSHCRLHEQVPHQHTPPPTV